MWKCYYAIQIFLPLENHMDINCNIGNVVNNILINMDSDA